MKRLILIAALMASPAVAQDTEAQQLPSETTCNAVRERVQLALAQADRALQAENNVDIELWSAVAAHYATVYAAFCAQLPE